MDVVQSFSQDLQAGPYWVNFMSAVIVLAVPFAFTRVEARWTLLVMALVFPFMMWLYAQFGFQRILGLAHVVFWTPLAIYLWRRRDQWRVRQTLGGKWILALFMTMSVSLVMDYADVVRYLMGERL